MEESKIDTNDFVKEKSVNYKLKKIGSFIQILKIKKMKILLIIQNIFKI